MNRFAYTLCHEKSCDRKLKAGPITYMGGHGKHEGGWVWRMPDEAQAFLERGYIGPDGHFHDLKEFAVYVVVLPDSWEEDVVPSELYPYHVLRHGAWIHWKYG